MHCAVCKCTLFAKKQWIRMFTKSKSKPAHQITVLEKQKSWENGAKSTLCSSKLCTVRTLIAKNCSIRMFTKSKFTSAHQITALQLERQKSWENGAKCALCSSKMCTVRTLIAKNYSIRMFTKSKFTPAHKITALQLERQKSCENRCKVRAVQCKMCTVRTLLVKKYCIRML